MQVQESASQLQTLPVPVRGMLSVPLHAKFLQGAELDITQPSLRALTHAFPACCAHVFCLMPGEAVHKAAAAAAAVRPGG